MSLICLTCGAPRTTRTEPCSACGDHECLPTDERVLAAQTGDELLLERVSETLKHRIQLALDAAAQMRTAAEVQRVQTLQVRLAAQTRLLHARVRELERQGSDADFRATLERTAARVDYVLANAD